MRSMTVFNFLLEGTLFGSVLILLAVAVRSVARRRLGSRVIYALWLLAALRLLLPISLPNPFMDEFRPGLSVDVGARPVADQVRTRMIDTGYSMSSILGTPGDGALHVLAERTSGGETGIWALGVWLVIAAGVACWLFCRIWRFGRTARRNRVRMLSPEEDALYQSLCQRYRVKPIAVFYVDRLSAACVAGVWDPFIAIPLHTPKDHLPLLLSHQLCHRRAHDGFWGVVRCLCCALHWFNPLVWMAAWLSWRDSEMACDDRVAAKLTDLQRLTYANVIVSAGERSARNLVGADAVGASFTDRHIRQRVTSVIRCVRGSRTAIAVSAVLSAFALVFSFATSESEPLPTIAYIPQVEWSASAIPIQSDMEAVACARRFLESAFVSADTSALSFTVRTDGVQWCVEARRAAQEKPIYLYFSHDGYLLEYDGTASLDGLTFRDQTYTHGMLTASVESYVGSFMAALVPGHSWTHSRALADVRQGDVRAVFGALYQEEEQICTFVLQVEPEVRILYCLTYDDVESNG